MRVSPFSIIKVIRDWGRCTWADLCTFFQIDLPLRQTPDLALPRGLAGLVRCGLVKTDSVTENTICDDQFCFEDVASDAAFEVTARWRQIQRALDLSLGTLSDYDKEHSIVANPTF